MIITREPFKEHGRVQERTKAVTASACVLAVTNLPYSEVLFYYMSYTLIFLFAGGQAEI